MEILVADDDRSARFLLSSTLIELGHSVTEATNGCEAWEAWKRKHHRLVISDWMMPGVDGLELCRRIRSEEESGLRLHHPDYGARGKGQLSGRDGFRR